MKAPCKTIGICSALLLTGTLLTPQNVDARPPRACKLCGVIQAIDPQTHMVTIQPPKQGAPATFAIKRDTRFIKDWKFTDAGALKDGTRACVYYRSPFFGKPFITKVIWENGH